MLNFTNVKTLTIPEGKIKKITRKSDGVVLWERATGRIPSAYQEVEWIQAAANVGAYINLGFSYNTGATIHLGQYIMNDNTAYIFGAAENSGKLRCMASSPYDGNCVFYCSKATTYHALGGGGYTKNALNEFKAIYKGSSFIVENLTSKKTVRFDEMISYTMTAPFYLFAQNYNGSARFGDIRRISYFKYYDKTDTLICDLVPCYRKSDGAIGMYDIVRNTFFTNAGTGSFTKGANV